MKYQKNAEKYPQESYATVVCAIQSECIFLQRVSWDTGDGFAGLEKMIREPFLLHLFFGNKIPLTHCRGSKYNYGQEIWIGTPEFSYASKI